MKEINKSPEPPSLTDFNRHHHPNGWDEIHTPENQQVYADCMHQCLIDQNYLCGYTEIKLIQGSEDEVREGCHIDHFVKRAIDNSKTFDWNNMIAAIHHPNYGADYKDRTVSRKDYNSRLRQYDHILNPVAGNMANRFTFSTNGTIRPAEGDADAAQTI